MRVGGGGPISDAGWGPSLFFFRCIFWTLWVGAGAPRAPSVGLRSIIFHNLIDHPKQDLKWYYDLKDHQIDNNKNHNLSDLETEKKIFIYRYKIYKELKEELRMKKDQITPLERYIEILQDKDMDLQLLLSWWSVLILSLMEKDMMTQEMVLDVDWCWFMLIRKPLKWRFIFLNNLPHTLNL